ncbi:CRISPR-associated protein Cas3 [Enterobacter hormaechei subsp. steigerwaltii]|uniref:type I-F CRISPR-associated helicase Cas3f n=1 Tax=Enterobacter hormaechei TaxID=158836 RepID=UPI00063C292A|nr:type I-F CRISPR-associated helicase Cas3f [Enterobacter hormaechei]KLF85117.1 CRISPR-associated protein Cas3 [Enterobacter hormaechei subsp. steigerwaltii]HCR0053700.1 type I-F CRISPR-associated helicase Cas3 [Enterobacter hormaechei]
MNVLIISRCTKRAREQSCQIIDQFAERTGDAAWQTTITMEGAITLRKLLRKTARRNTAVACHWLKKNGQTELLWIVGNLRRFNAQGRVPTNRTTLQIIRNDSEHRWHSAESIALLAAIAGLFHDFGKAGMCFQQTLLKESKHRFQPYRHEWISVRLFQAFVGQQTDAQWLASLEHLKATDEKAMLKALTMDTPEKSGSPLGHLPPLARVVAWLMLSHHRLPQSHSAEPQLLYCDGWLERQLNADWNSLNHKSTEKHQWKERDLKNVWKFPHGTPLRSKTWREKARQIGKRIRNTPALLDFGSLDNLFTLHLSRLSLMLADHFYSSQPAYSGWQDYAVQIWANSNPEPNQKLDEHNVGVAHHALLMGRSLPTLRRALPAIARHKAFRERAKDPRFFWQNKAWDVASSLRDKSAEQGFFGINMASTGCGKTFANARIMYALADEQEGCRFSVALGLRTLTLQTGHALQSRLGLDDDTLAVVTGAAAVKELYQGNDTEDNNSASDEAFFASHHYVHYEGATSGGTAQQWLSKEPALNRLVSAPVLVTTIDHLMPATEGVRGGRQIPAMLRLLTSDLVLDEPDDFDIDDLHALCRLVNWAGMLGSRVLLSSVTLPPALTEALFEAYREGRKAWQAACGQSDRPMNICCAWFDEYCAQSQDVADDAHFRRTHGDFVRQRIKRLPEQPRVRLGKLAAVEPQSSSKTDVVSALAQTLRQQMIALHGLHHSTHNAGKTVSFGLVRMANINPLVAVAQTLMALPSPDNYCIHYCVYHSQHPLAVRAAIEKRLDCAFTRHEPERIWQLPEVKQALASQEQHHLFVVLGTSVLEVGRDFDADWGIIEPSSMRSLIQFAGRIQRHRQIAPESENLVILDRNVRALHGEKVAYCRPGFETGQHLLPHHDLHALIDEEGYRTLNAIPRIAEDVPGNALAALEHTRLRAALLEGGDKSDAVAALWWRLPLTWNGELQKRTPFRCASAQASFFLSMEEEGDEPEFCLMQEDGVLKPAGRFCIQPLFMADGVEPWIAIDYAEVLQALADEKQMELGAVSRRYGEITLRDERKEETEEWLYHPVLGVFREYL